MPSRLLLMILAGCATMDAPRPADPLPATFASAGADVTPRAESDEPWWSRLDDPELHALIESSLRQNISLRGQWARLEQAQALADQARAGRFPQVRAQGSVGYNRSVGAFGSATSQNASASIPVSYELDIFRRASRTHQAAELDASATQEDVRAMALSTSAQVAESWYDLVAARARLELLAAQAELDNTYLELVTLRFREGLTSAVDVHQQRLQSARSVAQVEVTELQRELTESQLALLLGQPRSGMSFPTRAEFPELSPTPAAGVAADLLELRPDIRAARRRLEAADRRVAAAVAARLPVIRLNVTPGYNWNRNEFGADSPIGGGARSSSGFTLSAGASIDVPLFDGFAGRAAVDAQEAVVQQQIEALHGVILQALFEVETALASEGRQRRTLELIEEQASIADETLEAARSRYRSGLSDYLPVLTSLQARHALRLQRLDAHRQLVSRRIQLHRALGGRWPTDLERPEPSRVQEDS